jgi:nickel transport protein
MSNFIWLGMPGAVMKSLIRWGTTLGLAGSAIIGSSVLDSMRVLALPQEQIVQKLGPVPVFTITDNKGAPLVASVPNRQSQGGVAGVFISQRDAQAFVDQIKAKDPKLAKTVRVVPVSLGEVYKLDQANQNKPNSLDFEYVPTKQQVDAALTLLRQSNQKVNQFNATPLFVAKAGKEKGYLTIKQGNQQVIPFFFNKEELQNMLNRFKQQQPNLASSIEISVVPLEGMLQTLKTRNDDALKQVMLIPPRESIEFVRSLQPAGTQNQRPANPSNKR